MIAWPCGRGGGGKRCIQGIGGVNVREGDNLESLGGDRRMILKWNFRNLDGGMDILIWFRTGAGGEPF